MMAVSDLYFFGQQAPPLGENSLDEVINSMTVEEKATLLIGTGMPGYAGLTPIEGVPEDMNRLVLCV